MKTHIPSSRLWPALLLISLLTSTPMAQASGACIATAYGCVRNNPPPENAAVDHPAGTKMLATPAQASSTPTSLKKSVTRFSGGAASLRQQVIEQNKTSKAQ